MSGVFEPHHSRIHRLKCASLLQAIAGIRVYALWNRSYRLFAVVMITGFLPAFTNLVSRLRSRLSLAYASVTDCVLQYFRNVSTASISGLGRSDISRSSDWCLCFTRVFEAGTL